MSNQDYDETEGLADNNSSKKTYESKLVLMLTGCFEKTNHLNSAKLINSIMNHCKA